MQDPTHRAGREMMHWGLWPARGELVKPQSGARGRRARPWPSDAARPSRVRVAPRALRRTIVGLKPTQQRPLAAAPQLNFLYFEQYDRIGAERSILYRQTFDLPRVHSLQSNFRSASRVNQFVVTVQLSTFASTDPCRTHIMENTRKAGMRSNLHLRAPTAPWGRTPRASGGGA